MTLHRLCFLALTLAPLSLTACADDGGGDEATAGPEVECGTAPVPKFSEMGAIWAKCTNCHASTKTGAARNAAPEGYDFDVYASAKDEAAEAMHEVYEGTMPPAPNPDLTDAEKDMLYRWASCGTPE